MMTSTLQSNKSGSLRRREKEKKDESFLDKIGTLGRSKKKVHEEDEALQVEIEGRDAIDSSGIPVPIEISADDIIEGEERAIITEQSRMDAKVNEVVKLLIDWINDTLASERIVVKDIVEDLYDGLVIQKLLEKLANVRMEVPEVSQSVEGQRQKLQVILQYCSQIFAQPRWQQPRWSAESIHNKNLASILQLLVAVAIHFRAPIRFPEHCQLQMLVAHKRDGQLHTRYVTEEITDVQDEFGLRGERDAFDTLIDHAPDKLSVVKRSLLTFANKHLNKVNLEVTELEYQFQDGVFLVLLMGLLENYFVPLYGFHLTPTDFDQKVHNVALSFELMQEAGMPQPKSRPEDIVNGDMKCTLRILYSLFTRYKHV
ncbi:Beta-parvin [Trichinella pseudospiralis]|uniref:Beta-parvin n=2 Tax=Trichinella pseudospiralis TaxID=6337 RepID=A0A0V1J020_TRIPS|nr:Beta-parvin [Trichinella pseudospiralis]KRY73320.1 Beta-parvin [Trichinella pseudospiralis]KRY90752.1 Beta-parvin [Trichinella pseudospiralis]KRZ28308.1 Beta-parvin [Trichinella pseudospiralis]KRZ38878.1 Beta-parvin [Trichinella pseudospiralis]